MKKSLLPILMYALAMSTLSAQSTSTAHVDGFLALQHEKLIDTYKHLHQYPELSHQEVATAQKLHDELRALGLDVTTQVGGHGVVAVIKNGAGPTVMIRTDMDALPIKEETNLPYASKHPDVMHACGHDFHMTVWLGVAQYLQQYKERWSGTIVLVGQPAEETGAGARAMVADGLFTRFPKPDYALAIHVNPALETGKVGFRAGYALSNVDNLQLTVRGKGGHGAMPHRTVDPIVMASKIILDLQTIVSREISPILHPAVITVGAIRGGVKANIIPEEVEMQLTVRSFGEESRHFLLRRIQEVADAVALGSGLQKDRFPIVKRNPQNLNAVYNDPALTATVVERFKQDLGAAQVVELLPELVGEDFSNYAFLEPSLATLIYSVGTSPRVPGNTKQTLQHFTPVHASTYSPELSSSLKVGIQSMVSAVFSIMERPQ